MGCPTVSPKRALCQLGGGDRQRQAGDNLISGRGGEAGSRLLTVWRNEGSSAKGSRQSRNTASGYITTTTLGLVLPQHCRRLVEDRGPRLRRPRHPKRR